jgi:hypothetical protein
MSSRGSFERIPLRETSRDEGGLHEARTDTRERDDKYT